MIQENAENMENLTTTAALRAILATVPMDLVSSGRKTFVTKKMESLPLTTGAILLWNLPLKDLPVSCAS